MKLAVLGTGKIVAEVLPLLKKLPIEQILLLSTIRSQSKAQELMAQYELDGVYTDYDLLLNTGIDTVYIALPNHLHYSYAKRALERKKHVILEKPAVTTTAEFRALLDLARTQGVLLLEAVNIHHLPTFRHLKEDVKKLGRIKHVEFCYCQRSSRYDAFCRGEIHPVFDPRCAGGALYDINIYNVHAAVALFGQPMNIQYIARTERGIDVSGRLIMSYGSFPVHCIGAKDHQSDNLSYIVGDSGRIVIHSPVNQMEEYTLYTENGEELHICHHMSHRLLPELEELYRIIMERDIDKTSKLGQVSISSIEILEASKLGVEVYFTDSSH